MECGRHFYLMLPITILKNHSNINVFCVQMGTISLCIKDTSKGHTYTYIHSCYCYYWLQETLCKKELYRSHPLHNNNNKCSFSEPDGTWNLLYVLTKTQKYIKLSYCIKFYALHLYHTSMFHIMLNLIPQLMWVTFRFYVKLN